MTTSRRTAVLVAAFALLTAINPDSAHAWPEKGFRCIAGPTGGGTVSVSWPSLKTVSGAAESVYFIAVLHRYQNGGWEPYRIAPNTNPVTWYNGTSDGSGPMLINGYTFFHRGYGATEPNFGVPAGHYAVREWYHESGRGTFSEWATLQSNSSWAWYQPSGIYYCTFR